MRSVLMVSKPIGSSPLSWRRSGSIHDGNPTGTVGSSSRAVMLSPPTRKRGHSYPAGLALGNGRDDSRLPAQALPPPRAADQRPFGERNPMSSAMISSALRPIPSVPVQPRPFRHPET